MKKRMLVSLFCGLSLFLVVLIVGILRHMAIANCIFSSLISGTMFYIIVFAATSNYFDEIESKFDDSDDYGDE